MKQHPNPLYPFWDDTVVITRREAKRHYVKFPEDFIGEENSLSFCNQCGSPFTLTPHLEYADSHTDICAECGEPQE